jgi:hypothetical protein
MATKKSKTPKTPKKPKTKRSKSKPKPKKPIPIKPQRREDPFQLFMYHLARLPWYFVKFWDWLFTLITALLVYLTK